MASVSVSGGNGKMSFNLDTKEVNRAISNMESKSGKVMAEAIKEALREQTTRTQRYINSSVRVRHRVMGQRVADSIAVETFGDGTNVAEVAFGSDPIQEGGVTGSRGGKLALILENGIKSFEYPFTFKTIKNSPSWGSGAGEGGFINARGGGKNATYTGFEGIGWLAQAYAEVVPKIEERLIVALQEAFA
jgi:hypothetical protein